MAAADPPGPSSGPPDAAAPSWRSSRELLRAVKPCSLERSGASLLAEVAAISETWPRLLPILLSDVLVGGSNVPHLKHGLPLSKGVELIQRARHPADSEESPPALAPAHLVALVNSVSWAQEKAEAKWAAFQRLQDRLSGRGAGDPRIRAPEPGAQGVRSFRGDPRKPSKDQDLEILRGLNVELWFDEASATRADLTAARKLKRCTMEPYPFGVFEEPLGLGLPDFELLLEGCWEAAGLKDKTKAWVARKFLEYWEAACVSGPDFDFNLIHRYQKLWVESPPPEGRVAQRLSPRAATSLLLGPEALFPLSFRLRFLEEWVDLDGDCTELASRWLAGALAGLIPDPSAIAREGPARSLLNLVSKHQGLVAALLDLGTCKGGARSTPEAHGLVASLLLRRDINFTTFTPLQATTCQKIIACLASALKSKGASALSAVERETLSSFLRSSQLLSLKFSTNMLFQSQDALVELYVGLLQCHTEAPNEGAKIELTKRLLMLYAEGDETWCSARAMAPTADKEAVARGERRPEELRRPLPRLLGRLLEARVPSPYLSLGNFSANCAMLIQKKFFHSWLPPTFRDRLYEWTMEQVDMLFSLTGAVAERSGIDLGGLSQFFSSVALPAFRVEHVLQLWRRLTLSVDSWSFVQVSLAAIQKDSRFESSFRLARDEIEKRVAALAVPRHDQLRLDPRLTPELLGRGAQVQDESPSRREGLGDALRATHEVYDVLSEVLERLDSSAHGSPRADWVRAKQMALCPWRFRAENGPWAMRRQEENSERPAERTVACCQGKAIPSGLLPTDRDLDLGGEAEASRRPVAVPELPMAVINDSLDVTRAFYLAAIFHESHGQMERLKTKDDFELLKHWLDNLDWELVLRSSWVPSFGTARKKAAPGQQASKASTGATDILLRFVDLLSLRWADPKEAMHRCTLFWDRVSSAHKAISMADVEPADGRRYELLRLVEWHEELRRYFLLSQNLAWRSPSGWDELRSWVAYAQSLGSDAGGGLWGPRRSGRGGAGGGAAAGCSGSRADALGLLLIFAKRCPHLSGAMVPQAPGQAALPGQQPAAAAVVHSSKSFVLERCQAQQLRVTSRWDQRASRIDLRKSAEEEERLGQHAASRWEASSLEANLRLLAEHCSSVEELARVLGRSSLAAAKVLDLDGEEKLDGLRRELELTVPLSFGDDEEPRAASLTTEVKRLQKSIAGAERELQKMRFRRGGVAVAELLDFLVAGERLVLEECVRRQRQENTKLLWRLWWWSLRSSSCSLGACARRPIVAEEAARREREVLIRLGMLVEEDRMTFWSILRICCGCFGMMHRRLRRAANEAFLRGLRQKPLGAQVQIVKELYPLEASAAAEGAGPDEKLSREDADRILRDFAADPIQATVSKVLELIRATAGAGDVGAEAGVRRHEAFLRALLPALAQGWSIQRPRPDAAPPARRRRFRTVLAGLAELLHSSSELQALGREEDLLELWRRCGAALWASLDAEPEGQEPSGGGAAAAGDEGSLSALASFLSGESPESNFESWGERGLEDRAEPLAGLPPRFWGLLDFSQLAAEATALRLLAEGHEPLRPARGLKRSVFCGFSARAQSELIAGLLARCRGDVGGGGRRGDALLLLAEFVPLLSGPVLRELRQLFSILQKLVLDPAEEGRPQEEEEDVLSTLATEGLERHERQASGWSRVMQVLLRGLRDRAQGLHLESLASPSEKVTVGDLQELYAGDWGRRFEFLLPLHDLAAVSPNWLHTKEQEVLFRFCLTSVQKVPVEDAPDEGAEAPGGRYKESPLLSSTNCQYLCNLLEGKAVDPNHVSGLVSSILCDEEFESVGGPAVALVKETALRAMMRLGNDEKKAVVRELMAPIVEAMASEGGGAKGFVRLSPYTLFALSVVDIGGLDRGWLDALAWYVDRLIRLSEEEVRREKEGDGKPAAKYATVRLEKLENLIRDANPLKVNQVHTFPRSLKIQKLLCPRFLGRFQEDAAKGDHRFFRLFIATSAPRDVPVVLLGLLDRQLLGNNPAAEQLIFDAISSARVRTSTTTVQFRGFLEHIPDSQMPTRMEWVSRMVAPRSSVESGPEPPLSRVSSLGSEGFELVIVSDDGIVTAAIDEPLPSSPELPAGSGGSAQMMLREFLAHLLERRHRGSLGLLTFSLNNAVDSVGSLLKMYSSMSRAKTEEFAATSEMLAAVKAFLLELNAVALASAEPGADRSPVAMPQRLRSLWISFLKLRWSHALESEASGPDELEGELLECLPTAFAGCEGRGLRFEPLALQEIQGLAEVPGSPSAIRRMLTREGTPLGASARQSALACFGQAIIEDLIPVEALALGADDPPPSLTKFLLSLNEKEFQSVSMGKDRHVARVIVKSLVCIVSDQASSSQSGSYLTPAHVLSYACRAICKPLSSTSLGTSFVDDAEVEEAAVLLKQIYAMCDSFTRRQMRLQALVGDVMWSRKGEWMQSQILDKN